MRLSIRSALLVIALIAPARAYASGAIRGAVHDPEGRPIPAARIRIDCGYGILETRADAAGTFRFAQITPGSCAVAADAPGHTTVMTTTVTVSEGEEGDVDLELAPSAEEETVSMTRETPLLGRAPDDRQSVARDESALLPVVDPSASILRFVPSIVMFDHRLEDSGPYVAGLATPRSTLWTLRGVAVDEAVVRKAGAPGMNFVEEVAIVRDSERAPLVIALAPTRGSGHRGSVMLTYLDSRNADDGYLVGAEGGGRVIPDTLWAWASASARTYGASPDEDHSAAWLDLDVNLSPRAATGFAFMHARSWEPHLRSDLTVASLDQLRMLSRNAQLSLRGGLVTADLAGGRDVDDLQFDAALDVHGSEGGVTHDVRLAASMRAIEGDGEGDATSFTAEEIATRGNMTLTAALRYDRQESGRLRWESWSPRLSVAWLLERERRTLLFARYLQVSEPISGYLLAPDDIPERAPRQQIAALGLEHEIIPEFLVTVQLRDQKGIDSDGRGALAFEMIAAKRLSNGLLARGYVARQRVNEAAREAGIPDADWLYNVSVALQLPSAWSAAFVVRGNDAWTAGCDPELFACTAADEVVRGGSDAALDVRLGRGIRVGTVTWDAAVDFLDLTKGAARVATESAAEPVRSGRAVRIAFRTAF